MRKGPLLTWRLMVAGAPSAHMEAQAGGLMAGTPREGVIPYHITLTSCISQQASLAWALRMVNMCTIFRSPVDHCSLFVCACAGAVALSLWMKSSNKQHFNELITCITCFVHWTLIDIHWRAVCTKYKPGWIVPSSTQGQTQASPNHLPAFHTLEKRTGPLL